MPLNPGLNPTTWDNIALQNRLNDVYISELGRVGDADGLQFYIDHINAGNISFDDAVADINRSQEGITHDPSGSIAYNPGAPGNSGLPIEGNRYDQEAQTGQDGALGVGDLLDFATQFAQQFAQGVDTTRTSDIDYSPYLNQYSQDVIDQSLETLDRNNQVQQNQLDANAAAAGAFGGSRHGILGAEAQRGYQDQVADTTARLNQANFTNALGFANSDANAFNANNQFNANALLGASQTLSNIAGQNFNMQNTANANLARDGAIQQQTMQSLIDAIGRQTSGFTGSPNNSLGSSLAALGGIPNQGGTSTTQQRPGLFGSIGSLLAFL